MPRRRWIGASIAVMFVLGCGPRDNRDPQSPGLGALQARCELDMLRDVCRVTSGGPSGAAPDPASVVFVAGVGAIDATAYAELQSAGTSMCKTVVEACRIDWTGSRCVASRALFGGAAP